jgi:acetyl esterase/lipase
MFLIVRIPFLIVVGFAALGLLTIFPSPDWLDWKVAVFVCSYGYLLAVLPLLVALFARPLSRHRPSQARATILIGIIAALLLLQPCLQAGLLGGRLPRSLEARFGRVDVAGEPFSVGGLFRSWPEPVARKTYVVAGALKLDFYPAVGRSPAPCVIVIHGGGWDGGDRGELRQLDDWMARSGYAVAAVTYRLAPEAIWPAQRDDIAAAVAYLKANAGTLGIEASRLILFGRSAGGQIAQACAYSFHDPSIRGVIALYAPSDMRFSWSWGRSGDALNSPRLLQDFLGGSPEHAGPAYDSASGYFLAGNHSPPTLLIHGKVDTLAWFKQSERLDGRLDELGVPHLLVTMPWATHALEYNLSSPSGQLTTYALSWFLAAECR